MELTRDTPGTFTKGRSSTADLELIDRDNALRFAQKNRRGHVESYFLRANHPSRPLAFWLKATIFKPLGRAEATAELWCIVFDGEKNRTWAAKESSPYKEVHFEPPRIELEHAGFDLRDGGTATARLRGGAEGADGPCRVDLRFERGAHGLASPLCTLPTRRLLTTRLPKSKLLTPMPLLFVSGSLDVWGERLSVERWPGMQGHNWGEEHAHEYAWGQCHFSDARREPFCTVEAFSGRLKIGPVISPLISSMVIRRDKREYRFDRLVDLWRQDARIGDLDWSLAIRGPDGSARLTMQADPAEVVCLGYLNPNERLSYCSNSKLAKVTLRMNPTNEAGFQCTSEHGGALEFLRSEPDPRFRVV